MRQVEGTPKVCQRDTVSLGTQFGHPWCRQWGTALHSLEQFVKTTAKPLQNNTVYLSNLLYLLHDFSWFTRCHLLNITRQFFQTHIAVITKNSSHWINHHLTAMFVYSLTLSLLSSLRYSNVIPAVIPAVISAVIPALISAVIPAVIPPVIYPYCYSYCYPLLFRTVIPR